MVVVLTQEQPLWKVFVCVRNPKGGGGGGGISGVCGSDIQWFVVHQRWYIRLSHHQSSGHSCVETFTEDQPYIRLSSHTTTFRILV